MSKTYGYTGTAVTVIGETNVGPGTTIDGADITDEERENLEGMGVLEEIVPEAPPEAPASKRGKSGGES